MTRAWRVTLRLASAGVALVVASSCRDAIGPSTVLRVVPDTINLALGERVRLRLLADGAGGGAREISPDRWEASGAVSVDGDGWVTGVKAGLTRVVAEVDGQRVTAPAAVGAITYRNIDSLVVSVFRSAGSGLALSLVAPAIAVNHTTVEGNLPGDPQGWISTAYVGNDLDFLYVVPDGRRSPLYVNSAWPLRPAGVQRVLVLIVDYDDTNIREVMSDWAAAQDSVNGDHRALARALGYESPIVQFENTNVMVSGDSAGDRRNADSAYATLRRLGYEPDSFDIVVSAPISPKHVAGFAITTRRFVTIGCVYCPTPPVGLPVMLTREVLDRIMAVIYHHEVGHLWGWRHEWGGGPAGTRIIAHPVLFGWTDTDGDGVLEILDPTPYGIPSGSAPPAGPPLDLLQEVTSVQNAPPNRPGTGASRP